MPEHRWLGDILRLENTAMFQLKNRLDRLNTMQSHKAIFSTVLTVSEDQAEEATRIPVGLADQDNPLSDTAAASESIDTLVWEEEGNIRSDTVECDAKSPEGNKKIKALLGRRHTHTTRNFTSCGMILGRSLDQKPSMVSW